VKAVDKKRGYF